MPVLPTSSEYTAHIGNFHDAASEEVQKCTSGIGSATCSVTRAMKQGRCAQGECDSSLCCHSDALVQRTEQECQHVVRFPGPNAFATIQLVPSHVGLRTLVKAYLLHYMTGR